MAKDLTLFKSSASKYLLSYVVLLASSILSVALAYIMGVEKAVTIGRITGAVSLLAIALQYLAAKGFVDSVDDNDVPAANYMMYSVYANAAAQVLSLAGLPSWVGGIASLASYVLMILAFNSFKGSQTFPNPEGAKFGFLGYVIIGAGYLLTVTVIGACLGGPAVIVGFVMVVMAWFKLKDTTDTPKTV